MVFAGKNDRHCSSKRIHAELFGRHERNQHVVRAHRKAEHNGKDV